MIGSVRALVNQDMHHLSAIYRDRAWQSHLQVKKAYSIPLYEAYTPIAYFYANAICVSVSCIKEVGCVRLKMFY